MSEQIKPNDISKALSEMQQRIAGRRAEVPTYNPSKSLQQVQERIVLRRAGIPIEQVDKIVPLVKPQS